MAESLVSNSLLALNTSTGRCFTLSVADSNKDGVFTDLKYNEFQFRDVIRVNPILCGLTDKILLTASRGAVAFDWVSSSPHEIVELGELDDKGIIIVAEKRLRFQSGSEDGFEAPRFLFLYLPFSNSASHGQFLCVNSVLGTHIVLLDDFLEACIVELRELGQVMNIGNNIT